MFGRGFRGSIQFPQIDAAALPPAAPSAAPSRPGFFSRNGAGVDILGGIADGVLAVNGMRPVYQPMQDARRERAQALEDEERAYQQRFALATAPKPEQPRYFQSGNDQLVYDPNTQETRTIYDAPDEVPKPTALEAQVAAVRKLDPTMTDAQAADLIRRGISGAQYDPSVYRPMIDYRTAGQLRVKTTAPGKAPSVARVSRPRAQPKPPGGFILD